MKVLPSQMPLRRNNQGPRQRARQLTDEARSRAAGLATTAQKVTQRSKRRRDRRNLIIVAAAGSVALTALIGLVTARALRRRRHAGEHDQTDEDRGHDGHRPDSSTDSRFRSVDVASAR